MTIALFDFDGTITRGDSMLRFIIHASSTRKLFWGAIALLPQLILFKRGIISAQEAKEKLLAFFFKGWEYGYFKSVAAQFSMNVLPGMVRKSAMEKIFWHKNEGHRVFVVSASLECWLKPWCDENNIELICSRMQVKNGRLTGMLEGKNCKGAEKARRVTEIFDLSLVIVYAYGNSSGDREMLNLAHFSCYKLFQD